MTGVKSRRAVSTRIQMGLRVYIYLATMAYLEHLNDTRLVINATEDNALPISFRGDGVNFLGC
jgi:hypothetical protein